MLKFQQIKTKSIRILYGFLPSKHVFLVGLGFYIAGILFAYLEPNQARSVFDGGFYLGDIEAKIQVPQVITADYFINQFIYYLGAVSFNIFINNLLNILFCIFTGIAVIPILLIGLFAFTGSVTYFLIGKVGVYKGLLILIGSFHLYLEFLAAFLAMDAFLKFYGSFINAIRMRKPSSFKKDILNDFIPLVLRIALLLALASILEVFWSTWWVYILTKQYVSWYDFHFGVYSCLVK